MHPIAEYVFRVLKCVFYSKQIWCCAAYAAPIAAGTVLLMPDGKGPVAVIAPPGATVKQAATLVVNAGGNLVGVGGLPNVIVAQSSDPDFIDQLYANGAWLVVKPIVAGCMARERSVFW